MESWELMAREQIRDLVARYNANGDAGRFEHVMDLFAADAVMEVPDRVCTGHDEIMTIFTGAQEQVRGGETPGYIRHFTATHQIDVADPTTATGRCYYSVITPSGLDHWGRYLDEYRAVDGRWKFARRRVTVDGYTDASFIPDSMKP